MIEMFRDFICVEILKGKYEATNGGVSSRYDELYLCRYYVTAEDVLEYCEKHNEDPEKFVITERRFICGKEYFNVNQIYREKRQNEVGGMFGGNFIYASDSRYSEITGSNYPLAIHDRYKSQELYDMLSR